MSVDSKVKKMKAQIHCPVSGCLYFTGSERHFTGKKFLNQHIAKVHAEKKFSCGKCKKSFGLDWWRKHHEKTCGIEWKCHCGAKYSSRESLLTHARRTQHQLPDHVLNPDKGKLPKTTAESNNHPVILLIQPIIQNITCIQPVQTPTVSSQPILPKPIQPCFFTLPASVSNANSINNSIYSTTRQDATKESFMFNISSNSCNDSMPSQLIPSTLASADSVTSTSHKSSQNSIGTQTTDDFECFRKTRESRASQCSRRKSKSSAVGIESTHTQTAESAVIKIKKRRSRRKSVAITTESSMLGAQSTSMGQSLWPDFKDLILPNASSSSNRSYKNTTSTQTSTQKVLCDSQTLTDDEFFKFVWDEAVKGKDTSECFNSLVGMLPDMTSNELQGDIDQNNLQMLNMFSPHNGIASDVLGHDNKNTIPTEIPTEASTASTDKESHTMFSVFPGCSERDIHNKVSDIHTQTMASNVLDYNLLASINDGSKQDLHCKVSDMHTQTLSSNVLDYSLLTNMDDCSKPDLNSKVSDIHTQTMSSNVFDYNLLANMETQTTDDFSLYDLEFSDTETQTPWEDFPNIDDSPLPADQLSIEIQTDFSSLTPTLAHDPYDFINGLNMQSMMGECSNKETLGVNSETQTQDKFTFPQFTNSESQTLDLPHLMFSSLNSS